MSEEYDDGFEEGYEDGLDDGRTEGADDGRREAYQEIRDQLSPIISQIRSLMDDLERFIA